MYGLYDTLIAKQTGENFGDCVERRLCGMAELVGPEAEAFDRCCTEGATTDAVNAERAAGQWAGVDSTPSFVVNGTLFLGAQPYAES